ncbi:MAG: hypothetical protein J5785_06840 [Spirochaetales bacterium]|nr:hypothetical protein [Spirochaetales bacterium]
MKKILYCASVVLLVLCLAVSCDADAIRKTGDTMALLGTNVYGLQPTMRDVSEANDTVSNSVYNQETGAVEVNLEAAASVQNSVESIKESTLKTEAFQKAMEEPAATTVTDKAEVKTQIETQRDTAIAAAQATVTAATVDDSVKEAINTILETAAAAAEVSEDPTKGEVVSVGVVTDLATTVSEKIADMQSADPVVAEQAKREVAEKAMAAIDTLKLISQAANIDLLSGLDFGVLLGGDGDKALVAKEMNYLAIANKGMKQIFKYIVNPDTNQVDEAKLKRYTSQLAALRTAYETVGYALRPFTLDIQNDAYGIEGLNEFILGGRQYDFFSINDLVLYLTSVIFTEADAALAGIPGNHTMCELLNALLEANPGLLEGVDENFHFQTSPALEAAWADLMAVFGDDSEDGALLTFLETYSGKTTEDEIKSKLINKAAFIANTMVVLLVEADDNYSKAVNNIAVANDITVEAAILNYIGGFLGSGSEEPAPEPQPEPQN